LKCQDFFIPCIHGFSKYHHGDLKNALIKAGMRFYLHGGRIEPAESVARAGVSHSAPYAHFADKQALIAAITTKKQASV
jgi:hypothetical protein